MSYLFIIRIFQNSIRQVHNFEIVFLASCVRQLVLVAWVSVGHVFRDESFRDEPHHESLKKVTMLKKKQECILYLFFRRLQAPKRQILWNGGADLRLKHLGLYFYWFPSWFDGFLCSDLTKSYRRKIWTIKKESCREFYVKFSKI